ncbi:MAG: decarboxylating NADP(+)-dependent phosphogluconate dehydrogenase [Candidatus Latescibacterota bacterium]|nr:decarboxylating NADP(+)-dependent phosphogluconate dehydrogenase [Candidatus Latescibacterota bacterium]
MRADIGLVGLAVMGENLVLNMASHGFIVAVYNRTISKVDAFLDGRAKGESIVGTRSLAELVAHLKSPRRIMIMVQAGPAVDKVIEELLPLLAKGDILIDGGNSNFNDSIRRTHELTEKGFLYIGTGVSGGEEGALKGPSIMPGGNREAWPHVKEIFQSISAKVDDGSSCCDWIGSDGAGHYVKMIHNGIEYGDMQMICEAYWLMRHVLGMLPPEMSDIFREWNKGVLDSYLIEITGDILAHTDDETGQPMVDVILDTAGQKGTGKWTGIEALQLGSPTATITEAVFARCMSALKEERQQAAGLLKGVHNTFDGDRDAFVEDVRQALYASKICSYAQGFQLLKMAAAEHEWDLNCGSIALMWRGGCIIRAHFLGRIKEAFDANPDLINLLLAPYFADAIHESQASWRRVIATAVQLGIPVPAFSSALAYYDAYRSETLPANLLQAQRDYFGAHTYERVDKPRGEFFHTNWTGRGGATVSSSYTL